MNNVTKINLHDSIFAREYGKEEQIHKKEFEKVMQLIKKQLQDVENLPSKAVRPPRYHNTITIFGNRGSGKTSFLYSVLADLRENEKERVEILGFLDPTLIEEKEHIFLLVVSLINAKVLEKLQREDCAVNTEAYRKRICWEKVLKSLAKGLPTLEKVGEDHRNAHWQNHDYIMERGLKDVNAAFDLEKHFHELVNTALEILGKKAFVLALDDIDVNMRKGGDVLEMIRKYITTPKIITLLCGNYKLYSLNVRRLQWRQLSENKEYEPGMDYLSMVNELEGQYMMKVLKPEYRIRLFSLFDEILYYKQYYNLVEFADREDIRIEEAYALMLGRWGIKGETQFNIFCNYLLSGSFRSQVHFLINNETDDKSAIESVEAFLPRLYASNVNVDLATSRVNMLNVVIQQYLQSMEFSPDNYLLTPNMDDDNVNACFTAFTIIFAKQVKDNPFLFFDYAVRIGFTRNLLLRFDAVTSAHFYKHVGLNQNVSLKNCVGLSLAYVYGMSDISYSIYLQGLAAKSKAKEEEYKGRLDYELDNAGISMAAKMVAYLPITLIAKNNETRVNASLYSLLAVISDLLRRAKTLNSIVELLFDLSQLRIYPTLSGYGINHTNAVGESNYQSVTIQSLLNQETGDHSLKDLANSIWDWKQSFPQSIPPYLVGKIMTRLSSAVQQISQPSMGEYMQRCIIALFNACLVEETLENYKQEERKEGIENLNLNNAITDDKLFNNNLDFITRNNAEMFIPITVWLMQCPLLFMFLSLKINSDSKSHFIPYDEQLYDTLCKVTLSNWVDVNKPLFSGNKKSIHKMLDIFEEHHLDLEMILSGSVHEALNYLNNSGVFAKKVSQTQLKAFRKNHLETQATTISW